MSLRKHVVAGIVASVASLAVGPGSASAAIRYPTIFAINGYQKPIGVCRHGPFGTICPFVEEYQVSALELGATPSVSQPLPPQVIPLLAEIGPGNASVPHAADVDGDGLTDLVFWTSNAVNVLFGRTSVTGTPFFEDPIELSSGAFTGQTNTIGDLNGDKILDLVAWSPTAVWVEFGSPNRGRFSSPVLFSSGQFYGDVNNAIADVDHDGLGDLLAWGTQGVSVKPSAGYFAEQTVQIATPNNLPIGETFKADVANLVAERWGYPYLYRWGSPSIFFDELFGQGKNRPIAFWGGSSFDSRVPFHGNRANLALDVNQDGGDDLVAIGDDGVRVAIYNLDFSSAQTWTPTPFFGGVATLVGYTSR